MDTLVRILAVLGGAALGATLVGGVVRFGGKRLGARTAPPRLLFGVRSLAALAAGWAVWLFVFGSGDFGLGGSGGAHQGEMAGPAASSDTSHASTVPISLEPKLAVTMLGGDRVQASRFYRLANEPDALTFEELKAVIQTRNAAGLRTLEILIYEDSVAKNHAAVANLRDWAAQQGLRVTLAFPPGEFFKAKNDL